MSSGTVLFFENFHGRLAFEGCFFAVHTSGHVLMFGASLANGFATRRGAIAQSGCLTCGSLLANQLCHSAIRHRLVNCPSFGGQCLGGRWQANAQRHPAVVASPPMTGARNRGRQARKHRGRPSQCGLLSPEALGSMSNGKNEIAKFVRGLSFGRPVSNAAEQFGAKCRMSFS